MEEFKQSEEYATILATHHDAGYDLGLRRSSLIFGGNVRMLTTGFWGRSS